MSMAEYYQDQEMEAMASHDNEIDRLEKIAQAKILEDKTKKLIQQQMGIIKSEIIAARDKEWVAGSNKLYSALKELADLMDDIRTGEYRPDSFTTQPARMALLEWQQLKASMVQRRSGCDAKEIDCDTQCPDEAKKECSYWQWLQKQSRPEKAKKELDL